MTAKLIKAHTRLEAWMEAVDYLLQNGPTLNLILAIESPGIGSSNRLIDKFLFSESEFPMHTVAETIFPGSEYCRRGLRGVYDFYPEEVYPALKKHPSNQWGTYAYRLVRRNDGNGGTINPLRQMIKKMQSEKENLGPKQSCYELGIAEGEFDLPLYSPAKDGGRRRGGPCLSHLSFKLLNGAVHLSAFYRSHDYRYKVPGNLLGLARLQLCVAEETSCSTGSLVAHSSYAYLHGSKNRIKQLLNDLRQNEVPKEATDVLVR